MLGVPGSIPGRVLAQLVRAPAGWARWLVPCLGSPVQSQAGSLQCKDAYKLFQFSVCIAMLKVHHQTMPCDLPKMVAKCLPVAKVIQGTLFTLIFQ